MTLNSAHRLILACCLLLTATLGQAQEYAVVVHKDNAQTGLTSVQLRKIFKAEQQRWEGKGKEKIYLAVPNSKNPDRGFLLEHVYQMSDKGLAKHWVEMIYRNKITSRPKELPSTLVILRVVQLKQGAIAVVPATDVPKGDKVKVIAIDGKRPGQEGYALVASEKQAMAWSATAAQDMTQDMAQDVAIARNASFRSDLSQDPDQDSSSRMDDLEAQLIDMQVELATGGDSYGDTSEGPLLKLSGFGHVQAGIQEDDTSTSSQFALGGLDLFITSDLGEGFSFLNETVFEPTDTGEYVLDVERVVFKYDASDSLNLQAGRMHTTIGTWNERYHHGEWLQTSAGRPALLNFEDENGILPVHMVGLALKGQSTLGSTGFDYTLELGNGRGPTADPPQIVVDANDPKAVNLTLGFSPSSVEGLRIGGGVYSDRIPTNSDAGAGPLHGPLEELILSTFVTYDSANWELMAEFMTIDHDGDAQGSTSSDGYYLQLARHLGEYTPYIRYDAVELDDADTYFASVDDQDTIAFGVRWDFTRWAALKFQYATTSIDLAAGGDADEDAFLVQCSFAF